MQDVVFLDRDGVICEEVTHLHKEEDLRLIQGSREAIKLLNDREYLVIIISNQPVVARGICSEDEVIELNKYMEGLLREGGAKIDGFYYCPHHPEKGDNPKYTLDCECRKPNPGMILKARKDFNLENLTGFMVGDKRGDILAGKRAGCKTILVETGYGGKGGDMVCSVVPTHEERDLYNAVTNIILK